MALSTYNELKASVANWVSRNDLTNEIPDFIRIAESTINKRTKITEYEATDTISVVAGTNKYPLPIDYKTIRAAWLEGNYNMPLDYRTPTQFQREGGADPGQPAIYTIKSSDIILGPDPGSDFTLNLDYIAMLVPLSDTVQQNFLTQTSPDTILFGAVAEAWHFVQNTEKFTIWNAKFNASLEELVLLVEEMRYGGAPLEVRAR